MKIKYIQVFVKDMDASDKVVLDKKQDHTPMQIENSDQYLNLIVDKDNSGFKTRIILNTDDCLKDYHNLKTLGVNFKEQPQYLAAGLYAEFNDDYGNEFILLEERNYNDL
jgi:hypothetical protein